jgi:molecular chaperone DnaJ
LKGKGIKDLRTHEPGDQYVEVRLEVDSKLSREQKELYEKLKKAGNKESVFDKFKKSFK